MRSASKVARVGKQDEWWMGSAYLLEDLTAVIFK